MEAMNEKLSDSQQKSCGDMNERGHKMQSEKSYWAIKKMIRQQLYLLL